MVRILGTKGSRRRHRNQFAAILSLVALLGLFLAQPAFAVHDETFQLDGNTAVDPATHIGTGTQSFDWDSFFDASGNSSPVLPDPSLPGYSASGFKRDFNLKAGGAFSNLDTTTYTQGSKDIDNVAAWVCTAANNVTDKGDIMNAYAVAYTNGAGEQFLYFALERSSNNGDANVGFWFLQDGTVDCDATNGTTNFTGVHTDGDIFIVSAFTKGGDVSTITAYRWNGGANGSLGSTPAGTGGDCRDPLLGFHDKICATSNEVTINTKWLTNNNGKNTGLDNTLNHGEFFEGGINLTTTSLAGKCFNTFLGDTRSSQSTTATLYDFARGSLGECKTTLATQENSGGPLSIGTGTVSSGTDTATLTVTGVAKWGGTLTWYLCGPIDSPTLCDAHGVQVTSRTVSDSSPASDFVSDAASLTSAGRYCWHAHFEPDADSKNAGVKAADDDGSNECFTVAPVKPTLTTSASCEHDPCVLVVDTLSDTATLSGTATEPGSNGPGGDTGLYKSIKATNGAAADSSISWTLYLPSTPACTGATKTPTGSPVTVSGDGTYGPVTYKPALSDGVGVYTFAASYPATGLTNTTAADPVTCANAPNGEKVTVSGSASSASQQRWLPNDRVVLTTTGGTTLAGTLTVTLYPSNNCTGTAVSGQTYTFHPSGDPSGSVYQTTNTTFFVGTNPDGTAGGAAGAYSWNVHYDDNNLTDPADRCETSTVSPITDSP